MYITTKPQVSKSNSFSHSSWVGHRVQLTNPNVWPTSVVLSVNFTRLI